MSTPTAPVNSPRTLSHVQTAAAGSSAERRGKIQEGRSKRRRGVAAMARLRRFKIQEGRLKRTRRLGDFSERSLFR